MVEPGRRQLRVRRAYLGVVRRARIVPRLGDDAAYRYILDDENFKDPVDELPYVSVAVDAVGGRGTNQPQPTVLHAVCVAPVDPSALNEITFLEVAGHPPIRFEHHPEFRDGLVLMEPTREVQTSSDADGRIRLDPEVMVSGQLPFVFYSVLDSPGEARFWRAEARP